MAYSDKAVIADWESKWLDPDYDFYHHCKNDIDEIDDDEDELFDDEEEYDNGFDYSDNDADDARMERMGFNF